jgi:hypothetical protein
MARTITVTIPHKLSQQEAKRRIETGITDARARFGSMLKGVEETWNENSMHFSLSTMGQNITGRLHIEPELARLEVDLPLILAMFADKLRPRIEEEGRKLLNGPGTK